MASNSLDFKTLADLKAAVLTSPDAAGPHLLSLGEALTQLGTETTWLVDRLFALSDTSILNAQPGVGKSWFAQQLAVSVAMGKPFLGRKTIQGLVLYLAFEGAPQTVRRLKRLGLPPEHENFRIWTDGRSGQNAIAWLKKLVAESGPPVLIITDCLQNFTQTTDGNSYSESYKALGPLMQYAAQAKLHVLALHHSSAKEERSGVGVGIGSTGIPANFGTVLMLRRLDPSNEDGSSPRVLSCANKHRLGVMGPDDIPTVVLTANPFTAELIVIGSVGDVRALQAGSKIVEVLTEASEPCTRADLLAVSGCRKQTFEYVLARLLKLGIVRTVGRGPAPVRGGQGAILYSAGTEGLKSWANQFTDKGAEAFLPPAIPSESALNDADSAEL